MGVDEMLDVLDYFDRSVEGSDMYYSPEREEDWYSLRRLNLQLKLRSSRFYLMEKDAKRVCRRLARIKRKAGLK